MLLIAFLGGVLTLLSPCILPVLPLLLPRAGGPAWVPLLNLAGMASGFAALASLAALSGAWVVQASQYGRYLALLLLALSAASLLSPRLGVWLARPWVGLGERLHGGAQGLPTALSAFLLGAATGLLWAPCAGPILGLILSGAMLQGPSASTSLLLLSYGLGSALALGVLLFAGRAFYQRARASLPGLEWLRRGAGVLALLALAGIASGFDAKLAGGSSRFGAGIERQVLEAVPALLAKLIPAAHAESLPDLGAMPALDGATQWLNGPALESESLRGKVVLVDFWTYDCINCQHALPYVNQWAKRYADQGLVVIGVHTPEYPYERILDNVRKAVAEHDIQYPVAIDNQYRVWNAFANQYWPAHYFIDAQGRIRHVAIGEGDYDEQEAVIRELLHEKDAAKQ